MASETRRRPSFEPDRPFEDAEPPDLSVVVPVFEEAAILPALVERLTRVLDALGLDAEVLLVDDGSRDATPALVARASAADPRFGGIILARNFGQQVAISAGLAQARGRSVVVMDGDLQDPPEAIPALWAKHREGFDVVYAVRASRPEPWIKRLAYWAFYRLLDRAAAVPIPADAGDFGIISRRVVDLLNAMPERRRYLRGLRAWVGLRQAGVPIDRAPRHAGRPKFTLRRLIGLGLDGLVGFCEAPLRWAGVLGLAALVASLGGLGAASVRWALGWGAMAGAGWIAGLIGFFGGALLLCAAILGEYVTRTFHEVSARPLYVVREWVGLDPPRLAAGTRAAAGTGPARPNGLAPWGRPRHAPLRDLESVP